MMLVLFAGCGQEGVTTDSTSIADPRTRVDIEKNCYLVDEDSREILGQTTFRLEGWVSETGLIDGTILVEAYPIDQEKLRQHEALSFTTTPNGFDIYSCQSLTLFADCDTYYIVCISTDYPDIGVVYIFHNDEIILAVFAENEGTVWERFDAYLDIYMGREPNT